MRHAMVFKNRAIARRAKLRPCALLVGGGNRMIIGAIAQRKMSAAGRRFAICLALERRAQQNRRIKHIGVFGNHAIRKITALRKADQHLTELLESRRIRQPYNTVANLGACAAAFADRAAVRVPVVAADVGAFAGAAERQVVGVLWVIWMMHGRGVVGDGAVRAGGAGVGGCGVGGVGAGGCGAVDARGVAVATVGAVNRVDDADHLGFVVAVPVETEEQQIVGYGSALFEIDGPRDVQLHGMLLCSPCICHYREWAEFGDAGKATTDDFPCMLAASVLGICI